MINFFRKIRQKLLSQNRVARYFAYGVGEILLVVLGILIALQVNNWNEGRKQRQIELKYFNNLKNDLYVDNERLNFMIELANGKVKAAQNVKRKVDHDSIGSLYDFTDDMLALIFVDEFRPNENTYEEMKSAGNFSTIRNDELKLKLLTLNETYIEIGAAQEHMRNDFNVFLEDFEKYIDWGKYYDLRKSDIPKLNLVHDSIYIEGHAAIMEDEVRQLFKNKVFLNNIFLLEVNYAYNIDVLKNTKSQISEIVDIINQELVLE